MKKIIFLVVGFLSGCNLMSISGSDDIDFDQKKLVGHWRREGTILDMRLLSDGYFVKHHTSIVSAIGTYHISDGSNITFTICKNGGTLVDRMSFLLKSDDTLILSDKFVKYRYIRR
jgi:hypothetical protein